MASAWVTHWPFTSSANRWNSALPRPCTRDNRYVPSTDRSFFKRTRYAVGAIFIAHNAAGSEHFAYSRVGSVLGSRSFPGSGSRAARTARVPPWCPSVSRWLPTSAGTSSANSRRPSASTLGNTNYANLEINTHARSAAPAILNGAGAEVAPVLLAAAHRHHGRRLDLGVLEAKREPHSRHSNSWRKILRGLIPRSR